ncbi:MAG: hypothetical protein SPG80_13745 [Candidatus Ventricola sp.]|nr:hypothetical protein [Candidatus Ventricola sp.]
MMQHEFERITGLEISYRDYSEIIEPMYNALPMDKFSFCEMIKPTAKVMAKKYADERKAEEMKNQPLVFVNRFGLTPNGCYHIGYYAKVVGADIRTGKIKVRNLTPEEFDEQRSYHSMYWHDDDRIKAQGLGHMDYNEDQVILVA